MSTYLSIDLDFWAEHWDDRASWEFYTKMKVSINPAIQFEIVKFHQELLDHIRYCCPDTLINIDYHDDIIGWNEYLKRRHFNPQDFTWVNACFEDGLRSYTWISPNIKMYEFKWGICDEIDPVWGHSENMPFPIQRTKCMKINWNDICGVGFAVSPSFSRLCTTERVVMDLNIRDYF